ncbi:MAG TPA: ABC transporter ATP-binding protein [Candidatus Dojkabacteria bacterium]|jgi:ATP-binding cassette subfamily B protein
MEVFKKFYKFTFKYKRLFVLSITFIVLYSIFSNLFPVFLRELVTIIQSGEKNGVEVALAFLIFVKVMETVIHPIALYLSDALIIRVSADVRLAVFKHLHNLDFAFHANKSSGSLISMFKRGEAALISFHDQLNVWILKMVFDFVFLIIFSAFIYPKITVIVLVVVFLNIVAMLYTLRKNIRARNKFNDINDEVTAVTVDNMIAFDTVKYFANERLEQRRLNRKLFNWKKLFTDYVNTFRMIDILNGGLMTLGMIVVIVVAIFDYSSGIVGLGDVVLAISFATLFFPNLKHMVFMFREIVKLFEDLKKYLLILDEKVKVDDNPKREAQKTWRSLREGQYSIEFRDMSFSYDKSNPILDNLNLYIKPGESVAFVGKSGAGKTTITKLIMRFYDVDSGSVNIGGVDVRDIEREELRKKIGIVPQEAILFNSTLKYNIAYGKPDATLKEIENAASTANLQEFIQTLPKRLSTFVGERGIKLSGGQRQRLSIARVFLENSPIIIFDEATSNLDSESEKLIQEAFWRVSKDKTTIIIAHRLSTIRNVDRIIVFDKGRIIEQGTHKELLQNDSGIYKYLLELQKMGELGD